MDNVLQTWFHLLLLISTVCMIWLHFWVDKRTEPKTGLNHTWIVPVMNIFIIAKGTRESLTYPSHPSHVDSQTDTSPQITLPQDLPQYFTFLTFLISSRFQNANYDPCAVQFKPVETVGQAVIQHLLGNFWNMNTNAHIDISLEGTVL